MPGQKRNNAARVGSNDSRMSCAGGTRTGPVGGRSAPCSVDAGGAHSFMMSADVQSEASVPHLYRDWAETTHQIVFVGAADLPDWIQAKSSCKKL